MHCVYSVAISDNSALNFIEIIVLIRWIGTQPQIRMGVGSKAFHAGGGMRGQICLPYAKILKFYTYVSFIQLIFAATRPIIFLK